MYVDKSNVEQYTGMIVYKSFNPKTLYVIESVSKVNDFNIMFEIKDEKGTVTRASSAGLKPINDLITETENKLNNHKARLWNFQTKLGLITKKESQK